ncbi:MAG: 50S ribosomal protein L17 [Nitrospirae bacterium]|nr:50S ribosomal protein L17 [Nitrospirota bacterium]
MRHRKAGRQLGRDSKHRRSLYRNLVTSFLEHERVETTVPKAKEVKSIAEKMITLGKEGGLHARRRAMAYIKSEDVVSRLFDVISPRFLDRSGGYSRLIRTRRRLGDAAEMAVLELVGSEKKAAGKTAVKAGEKQKEKA